MVGSEKEAARVSCRLCTLPPKSHAQETKPKQDPGRVSLAAGQGHAFTQLLLVTPLLTDPSGGRRRDH